MCDQESWGRRGFRGPLGRMCGERALIRHSTLATIENKLPSYPNSETFTHENIVKTYFHYVLIMRNYTETKRRRCSVTRCSGAPSLKQTNNEIMDPLCENLLLGSPCGQI